MLICILSSIQGKYNIIYLSVTLQISYLYDMTIKIYLTCTKFILGTHANCANITNLTRISATSVVVEWEYHQSSQLSFDIMVFELERSSTIQRLSAIVPERKAHGGFAYLANSDAANAPQLVCFTVSMATSDPLNMTTTSSGLSADDMCPKKCLPSTPGQSKCTASVLLHVLDLYASHSFNSWIVDTG